MNRLLREACSRSGGRDTLGALEAIVFELGSFAWAFVYSISGVGSGDEKKKEKKRNTGIGF